MLKYKNTRRDFLKQSAVVTAGTIFLPAFLKAGPYIEPIGKKLVVIQLSGGNDGLNTIIPYKNDYLLEARPNLSFTQRDLLKIKNGVALNPAMEGFRDLYDKGDVCIINSVGYPNPNRSHFRSMDIWQTASDSSEYLSTGWLGRFLDNECPDDSPITAVEMGKLLSMAMKGEKKKGIPLQNIYQFYNSARQLRGNDLYHGDNPMAAFLYKTKAETTSSAKYLFEKNKIYQSKKTYPETGFANQLKEVAEMLVSRVDSQVYYVSLTGFDTHSNQRNRQNRLLGIYSEAIRVFVEDLKENDLWDDTLILTFSEFGRRVKENASSGTDHGKANNVFLIGGKLKKRGIYNDMPSLDNLADGDVPHEIDFREVYSTILKDWLETDAEKILGRRFGSLGVV